MISEFVKIVANNRIYCSLYDRKKSAQTTQWVKKLTDRTKDDKEKPEVGVGERERGGRRRSGLGAGGRGGGRAGEEE